MSAAAFNDTAPIRPEAVVPIQVQVVTQEVTVTFTQDPDGRWSPHADPPQITLHFNEICTILWTLVVPEVGAELTFDSPPITFPPNQQLAPMQIMSMPNSLQVLAMWSNISVPASDFTYSYFINAIIGGQPVSHDPTVQNDPPG